MGKNLFDAVGESTFGRCRGMLASTGVYLSTRITIGLVGQVLWTSSIGTKRAVYSATGLRSVPERPEWLEQLIALIEAGQLRSVVDRS